MTVRIINADVRDGLKQLEDESVHCCVCSPPYWGLRDYGTAKWEGGDPACDHIKSELRRGVNLAKSHVSTRGGAKKIAQVGFIPYGDQCGKCGALRIDKQLGLEPTLGQHIDTMVEVMREVRRVLRRDGTLWLNYGDCYATAPNGRSAADTKSIGNDDRTFRDKPFSTVGPVYDLSHRPNGTNRTRGLNHGSKQVEEANVPIGRICAGGVLKPKDLCGVPWRLALALQDDGWWLRQDIIWSKPNPMPESIKDRCTKAHEYLFLLAKSERYYFDAEAIAEPSIYVGIAGQDASGFKDPTKYNGKHARRAKDTLDVARNPNSRPHSLSAFEERNGREYVTRNKRSVWEVATAPFPEAHFATFPPDLVEPCIKAGTSERGCCSSCGKPWEREVKVEYENPGNRGTNGPRSLDRRHETAGFPVRLERRSETAGWYPACKCDGLPVLPPYPPKPKRKADEESWRAECDQIDRARAPLFALADKIQTVPARVLDPFGGSGTVALVARNLDRHAILIDLNADYCAMADRRVHGPLFAGAAVETASSSTVEKLPSNAQQNARVGCQNLGERDGGAGAQ